MMKTKKSRETIDLTESVNSDNENISHTENEKEASATDNTNSSSKRANPARKKLKMEDRCEKLLMSCIDALKNHVANMPPSQPVFH